MASMQGRTLYYIATRGVAAITLLQLYGLTKSLPTPIVEKIKQAPEGSLLKAYQDAGYHTTCYQLRIPLRYLQQENAKKRTEPYIQPHYFYNHVPSFFQCSDIERFPPYEPKKYMTETYLLKELTRAVYSNHATGIQRSIIDRIYNTNLIYSISNTIPKKAMTFMDIARQEAEAAREMTKKQQSHAQKVALTEQLQPGPADHPYIKEQRQYLLNKVENIEKWFQNVSNKGEVFVPSVVSLEQQRLTYITELDQLEFNIGDRIGMDIVMGLGYHDHVDVDSVVMRGLHTKQKQIAEGKMIQSTITAITDPIATVDSSLSTISRPLQSSPIPTSTSTSTYQPLTEILFRSILPQQRPSYLQPQDRYIPPSFRTYISSKIIPSSTTTSTSTSSSSPVEDRDIEFTFGTVLIPGSETTPKGTNIIHMPWYITSIHSLWSRIIWSTSINEMISNLGYKLDPEEQKRRQEQFEKEYPLGPDTYYV